MRWANYASSARDCSPGERIRILVARFLGVGFIGYLVVSISGIAEGAQILAWWWTPLAVLLVFGPGVALLVAALIAPARIATAAGIAALGISVAAVLWPVAWNGEVLDDAARSTWLSSFAGLAGLCAALVWRPAVTFAVQLFASSTIATIDQLGLFGPSASVANIVYAAVWAFGLSALLTTAVIMALRTGKILDSTRESLERTAAASAAAQAREFERARFDALIHDRVLATLLGTTRPDVDGRLAADARSTLLELDRAVVDPGRGDVVTADRFAEQLSVVAADHGATTVIVGDSAAFTYPAAVHSAVGGATAEAIRNSVMHAGPRAACRVVVELGPNSIHVVVTDTGRGFDTTAIGAGRLGIEMSIVGRMANLDGGRSDIASTPGSGTSVALAWTRPT